jgi:hypothetical protein
MVAHGELRKVCFRCAPPDCRVDLAQLVGPPRVQPRRRIAPMLGGDHVDQEVGSRGTAPSPGQLPDVLGQPTAAPHRSHSRLDHGSHRRVEHRRLVAEGGDQCLGMLADLLACIEAVLAGGVDDRSTDRVDDEALPLGCVGLTAGVVAVGPPATHRRLRVPLARSPLRPRAGFRRAPLLVAYSHAR